MLGMCLPACLSAWDVFTQLFSSASAMFQHEGEAQDGLDEALLKTEEETRSDTILDSEEARELYLCQQVWHTFESVSKNIFFSSS